MIVLVFSRSRSRVDGDVVHVNHYAPFVDEVAEDCVHHGLEGGRRVSEAKKHDCWLVKSFVGYERRLPSVFWFNQYFVVSPLDIDASELCTVSQLVDQGRYEGERVAVLDRPGVHWPIVLDGPELSVLFLDEEEGRGVGALGWLD